MKNRNKTLLIILTIWCCHGYFFIEGQYKVTHYEYNRKTVTRLDYRNSPYDSPCLTEFYDGKINQKKQGKPYYEIKYCGRDGYFSGYIEFLEDTIIIYGGSDLNSRGTPPRKFLKRDLHSKEFFLSNSQFNEFEYWKQKCNVIWVYPLGEKMFKQEGCITIESTDWHNN